MSEVPSRLTTALADRYRIERELGAGGMATVYLGTPHPLLSLSGYREARNRQQYDVSPDDHRFIMIRESAGDASGNVVHLENWLAELEAKVQAKR
jgi:hypothetical protein